MDIKKLTDGYSVSGQIAPYELAELAELGFQSVICNRPDGESADQSGYDAIRVAATAQGLEIRYVPIYPGTLMTDYLGDFKDAMDALPKPVLAYCRSGARSGAIFEAFSQMSAP